MKTRYYDVINRAKELLKKLGGNEEIINNEFAVMKELYEEDHRFYHNHNHVIRMLEFVIDSEYFDKIFDEEKIEDLAMTLAIAYHDIVYIPTGKYNEEASLDRCYWALYNIFGTEKWDIINRVEKLIMATKVNSYGDFSKQDDYQRLIIIADLEALSSDYKSFVERQERIINEAAYYSRDFNLCKLKTIKFFNSMLSRNNIFPLLDDPTIWLKKKINEMEKAARENMKKFLADPDPFMRKY